MQIKITELNEQKTTCKRTSKIKRFFDNLLDKFLKQLKEDLKDHVKDDQQLIDTLNEFLQHKQIIITLDEEETMEFRKYSRRDYSDGDTCTLLENGVFLSSFNGPKQFIKALLDIGIKPPIKVRIKYDRQGKINIKFTRKIDLPL